MMLKRFLSIGLSFVLIIGGAASSFAESIDINYATFLVDKFAAMTPERRTYNLGALKYQLANVYSIESAIKGINSGQLSPAQVKMLADNHITNDTVIQSLRILKKWLRADRYALVEAAAAGDMETIKKLNAKYATKVALNPDSDDTTLIDASGTENAAGGTTTGTTTDVAQNIPPVVPAVVEPVKPVEVAGVTDSELDALLNSKEFKALINIEDESTAKGVADALKLFRANLKKTAFKLPENIKKIDTLITVKNPKANATKLDLINMLSKVFINQDLLTNVKVQKIADVGGNKATQLTVSYLIEKGVIKLDAKGNIGSAKVLTKVETSILINDFFKAMGIGLPKDMKKAAAIKDISKLSKSDQDAVIKMVSTGILVVDKKGNVEPMKKMNQRELATAVKQMYSYYSKKFSK